MLWSKAAISHQILKVEAFRATFSKMVSKYLKNEFRIITVLCKMFSIDTQCKKQQMSSAVGQGQDQLRSRSYV